MIEHLILSKGAALHVVVDGPADAPCLALLNVARSNLGVHNPMLSYLGEQFRIVRHDGRGTGRSGGGERADYNFETYADDLASILDVLEIPSAIVCGSAYGARTAARFALRHAGRAHLLALFDVSLDQPVDQTRQRDLMTEARRMRDKAALESPALDRAWFAHRDEREAGRSLTAHVGQRDPTPELASMRTPTLVACGRQDMNLVEAERIAAVLPDAEFHVMEMTSHPAIMSRPALAAELLVDFIERRSRDLAEAP